MVVEKMKKLTANAPITLLCIWFCYTLYLVLSGTKLPGSDVFIFKEAGVNLALKGRFVVSNLPFMPSNQEFTYYFYPPLYPFIYGVWTKIVGFGYSQGVLFDCLIRLIRTLLILGFLIKPLKNAPKFNQRVFLFYALLLSFFMSDGDRPDDLAALFGLAAWHFLFRTDKLSHLLCGLFIGLCASTSATAGVFFTIGVMAYYWPWWKKIKNILPVALVSVLVFLAIVAPTFIREPELYALFNRQASFSNFLQFRNFEGWSKLLPFLIFWAERYYICLMGAPAVTLAAILVLVASLWVIKSEKLDSHAKTFATPAIVMFALTAVVWIMQPYYLWFSYLSFFIFIGTYALKENKRAYVLLAIVGVSLIPKSFDEAKGILIALQEPKQESQFEMSKEIKKYIPVRAKVSVTHDQFYLLGREYQISNVGHICMHAEDMDFIYMSRMGNAKQELPIPHPCNTRSACFEVVANTSQNKHFTIAGKDTGYFVKTSGGTLYKNVRCVGKQIPWDVSAEQYLKEEQSSK